MSVQCASPGRGGGEFVSVCAVCRVSHVPRKISPPNIMCYNAANANSQCVVLKFCEMFEQVISSKHEIQIQVNNRYLHC